MANISVLWLKVLTWKEVEYLCIISFITEHQKSVQKCIAACIALESNNSWKNKKDVNQDSDKKEDLGRSKTLDLHLSV